MEIDILKAGLAKYLEAGQEARLKIFLTSANPKFKLTKETRELLDILIEDYKATPSDELFNQILTFLGYKPTVNPVSAATNLNSLEELTRQADERLRRYKNIVPYDILDELVEKNLGSAEDKDSLAYKILNNQIYEFQLATNSIYQPHIFVKKLYINNKKEQIPWFSYFRTAGINGGNWVCSRREIESFESREKYGN